MPHEPLDKVYDPRAVEPAVYTRWEDAQAFKAMPDGRPHAQTYTIVIPPPNVTGALHLGHALNNTLQDILIRYHRMRGFNTLWQPGTDHAGIATQAVVERRIREQEGKTRFGLGATELEAREELVRRIWQWKDEYEKRIISQLKLMGCSCDWSRNRFTLDEGLARAVRHMFFMLFRDGLIFRGKRLVNWDTQLQTAVSDDEVYYETVKGHFWHLRYPVIDPQPGEPDHVVIATTRPETMLGDVAVAVHPDPEGFLKSRQQEEQDRFDAEIAKPGPLGKKANDAMAKEAGAFAIQHERLSLLIKLRDMAKAGRKLRLPLVDREIPLIMDEWADPTLGTGCVKITPAHDPNDYEVGLRHNLPMINVLTPDGRIAPTLENANREKYAGLPFSSEGRDKVRADLEAGGFLDHVEDREIELGHSDRSKLPIEPFLSDQWFVRTGGDEPRASARAMETTEPLDLTRAMSRTPDLSWGATLLTWTTYGTWLPGDKRGSVSRALRPGGRQELRNLPGEPYDDEDEVRNASAADRMEGESLLLEQPQAEIALRSIADTAERHGIELLAVAIMRNHIHVLCQAEKHGPELLQLVKGNASRALGRHFELEHSPRWWTKSGSRRRIKGGSDLTAAIEYVRNQEHPLLVWSFVQDHGTAQEIVEIARAEARGSGKAGLAQAAMDAVENARIRVFPQRYAKGYLDWLSEKRDWCISRQLWWGHRIPVWHIKLNPAAFDGGMTADHVVQSNAELAKGAAELLAAFFKSCNQKSGVAIQTIVIERMPYLIVCLLESEQEKTLDLLTQYCDPAGQPEDIFDKLNIPPPWGLRTRIARIEQDNDVLDTWFSSALWPFSTLGWPERTEHLKQYYPGSVLCTSRDIITNWVARMVMFGLYAMGEVPFDHVYIHPKILDGRGETMSKSKGNGVDPVDIIHTHGADALRYTLADMTTETQDIRMPVEYVCPHCGGLTDQGAALKAEEQDRKSRGQKLERRLQPADCHRVKCGACGRLFATQWADAATRQEIGLARETSDKFEIGRNFCNKLWNAARFAFMNLAGATNRRIEDATPGRKETSKHLKAVESAAANFDLDHLLPEDRWILARLSQTIRRYHQLIAGYQFAASVKELRDFFWDSMCDWYLELTKPRFIAGSGDLAERQGDGETGQGIAGSRGGGLQSFVDPEQSTLARQILAFCLDQILRLWHPTIPFITERLWQELNAIAPHRGLAGVAELKCNTDLILAEFPPVGGYPQLDDPAILATFAALQDATRGVRELRNTAGVAPKERVTATVVMPSEPAAAFEKHAHILKHMAGVGELHVAAAGNRPPNAATMTMGPMRIFVHGISDDDAERHRAAKSLEDVERQLAAKESKLRNEKFVSNAKPEVVEAERQRVAELLTQRDSLRAHLAELTP